MTFQWVSFVAEYTQTGNRKAERPKEGVANGGVGKSRHPGVIVIYRSRKVANFSPAGHMTTFSIVIGLPFLK